MSNIKNTKDQDRVPADKRLGGAPCYVGLKGAILKRWDWWIYCRAHKSLHRICEEKQGFGYLMELQLREWNGKKNICPQIKRATEVFYESLQHNDLDKTRPSTTTNKQL